MPGCEVARAEPKPRETVAAFLRRTGWAIKDKQYGWQFKKGLPTIVEVNGEAVLRKQWRTTRIAANDNVRFVSYPLGGQGNSAKQVIGLVALVAVSAFALWAGPALFGAGTLGAYATTAAIGMGGAMLVSSLTAPKAGATNAPDAKQDQIYTVGAQGNTAKLGQPLPIWYGRLKRFPDFAATPWGEFVGNDQYLNVLLSTTMGSLSYETLFIDDTPFWTAAGGLEAPYSDVQLAFYEPGAPVTLFPVNVSSSSEVSGQELPDGTGTFGGQYVGGTPRTPGAWLGGFVANPSGTQAQSISFDFVLPGGCFTANQNGNDIGFASIAVTGEACPCNDAGTPTGSYANLFTTQFDYNSTAPIRQSIKVDVGPGRYLVRFRREDASLGSTQGSNKIVWAGLRAYLKGNSSFPDVSTIAIRIKATQSTQGSYKFGVLATRKLPVWNGSSFVPQPTRNPAWAFLDAVASEQYGSGLSLGKVDFNAIVNFAAGCTARGDTFDYCFSAATAVPEALDKILTPARSRHFWLGDTVSIVRDEWRTVPTMLLTDREIVRDSTQVSFTMLGDEDPDAVIVEYVDQETWLPAQVQYPPDTEIFTATQAEVKRIDGVINREHAFRECAFYYLQSIYRRERVEIGVEYEGRALTFGQDIRIQSELPMAYGYGGAVVAVAGNTLTLNPAPVWEGAGPYRIRLRRPNGLWFGPVLVSQGASAAIANLDGADLASAQTSQGVTLAQVLAREDGGEYPSFTFGAGENRARVVKLLSGVPNGDHCTLTCVVDDIRVHATELGLPPVLPLPQFPKNPAVPVVFGLSATFGQGTAEPKLEASWFPTPGALYYIADVSYDAGKSWAQVYEGQDNKLTSVVALAALRLRVQAVTALVRGPYASLDLDAPTITISRNAVALASLNDAIREQVTTEFNSIQDRISEVEEIGDLLANEIARNRLDKTGIRGQTWSIRKDLIERIEVVDADAAASIEQVKTVALSTQSTFAAYTITVNASLGSVQSQVTSTMVTLSTLDATFGSFQTSVTSQFGTTNSAITSEASTRSTADTALAGTIDTVSTTVNGHTTSISTVSSSINGISAQFGVLITNDGGAPTGFVLSGIRKLDGTFSTTFNMYGDILVNGSVTAGKMNVATLSAITANIGEVTAGLIRGVSNKMRLLLNDDRIEIWS